MARFKKGQRVRVVEGLCTGDEGTVTKIDGDRIWCEPWDDGMLAYVLADDLELVKEPKNYELPNTVVHTPTQADFDEVMEHYKKLGWKLQGSYNEWDGDENNNLDVHDGFSLGDSGTAKRRGETGISMDEWRAHMDIEKPLHQQWSEYKEHVSNIDLRSFKKELNRVTNKETIMSKLNKLTQSIKRRLNKDIHVRYQLGWADTEGYRTDAGEEAVFDYIETTEGFQKYAEAELAERKKEEKDNK